MKITKELLKIICFCGTVYFLLLWSDVVNPYDWKTIWMHIDAANKMTIALGLFTMLITYLSCHYLVEGIFKTTSKLFRTVSQWTPKAYLAIAMCLGLMTYLGFLWQHIWLPWLDTGLTISLGLVIVIYFYHRMKKKTAKTKYVTDYPRDSEIEDARKNNAGKSPLFAITKVSAILLLAFYTFAFLDLIMLKFMFGIFAVFLSLWLLAFFLAAFSPSRIKTQYVTQAELAEIEKEERRMARFTYREARMRNEEDPLQRNDQPYWKRR